ncbi:MAG TPA: ROK family protein [Candidatus Parabacteroides intestinipullorum]|jgi:glucokinase|uniref:ROK family protein n=1 Tax=Candidatus Parabacteroides intestinipullorum TaxID=2838723 RepID=A0A9D1XA61_9BACT|nr:ROK family protein [Candidatus Parabacteroides intestinipullorum]
MSVYIGVDLGGTNMRAGRVENDCLVAQASEKTPKSPKDTAETIDLLERVIRSVWTPEVSAIGIGVPGLVDRQNGVVYNLVNIPHWDVVPLREILEARFGVRVVIDNDANCFALGERVFGVGRQYENFVGLTLGTGLGGGIIQQGRLLADSNCGSGEFGMMPYRDNILEYYCSGSYFMNIWGVDGKTMYERALKGDAEALEAYRQLGEHIAAAVKIVMLAVDPEMIVFGGSVAAAHALFEKSLWENLRDFAYPNSVKRLRIFFSEMENPAILGAASLCY